MQQFFLGEKMGKVKIGILGGGASGMIAAIEAARNGADVTIIERLDRVGKKLLTTGNGRCNYTNILIDISRYHSTDLIIARDILDDFSYQNVIFYFKELGIEPFVDETGKIYPMSLQASSIVDVLRDEYLKLGVKEICGERITKITKSDHHCIVTTDQEVYEFDRVVIALGGKANSKLGSDGSGLEILAKMGVNYEAPYPALVKLKSDFPYLKSIMGLKVNAKVTLCSEENSEIACDEGEVLFADYGVSGPPILQLSGKAIEMLNRNHEAYIKLDLFPELNRNELYQLLNERFDRLRHKTIADTFIGLVNKRLIIPLLKHSSVTDFNSKPTRLNTKQIYQIVETMKALKIHITGYHSWQDAQVTAGGVCLSDINPKTMELRLYKSIYLAGEILDVYGDCGGFNLHWAWATGIKAGKSAAKG
jgi:predicted Rossmann fold flavoprotein